MALRQQVLALSRAQKRSPKLTMWDRLIFGITAGALPSHRLQKTAIAVKPATFLRFHKALVARKYRKLFSQVNQTKPGPKGPSTQVIQLVIELKRRNPTFGYLRIAMQVNDFLGTNISKYCVRRILKKHKIPKSGGDGPSWLTFLGHANDSLWSLDLFCTESAFLKTHWVMLVIDQFSRRIIDFAVHKGSPNGEAICQMLNKISYGNSLPKILSTDNDPLFEFYRFKANLRILEIAEVKSVPSTPTSHAFVERTIGTTRREFLDRALYFNARDLEKKLSTFKDYYNGIRCHVGIGAMTPQRKSDHKSRKMANIDSFKWQKYCGGLFQLPKAA
jgi:transposase InsO family protein